MFGVCAEVFEDDLVPFVPRILKNVEKVLHSEGTNRLHGAISETIGSLVYNITPKILTESD